MKNAIRSFFLLPVRDVMACLEAHVDVAAKTNPARRMIILVLSLPIAWIIYVPIHELLHVLGCVMWGGEVTRLDLSPIYGAALLKKIFPFVVSGSDYAGQLKGFDTHGNDWIYLSTCFLPFALTVLFGVTILRLNVRFPKATMLAIGIVVGLAPFYNMQGDYFEMGSIIVTRILTWINGAGSEPVYATLRSDDVFKLIGTFFSQPAELKLNTTGEKLAASLIIFASGILDVLLTFLTYALGALASRPFLGQCIRPSTSTNTTVPGTSPP